MAEPTEGLAADLLFVAATRPPTRWGVPYLALLINMVVTMEVFLMVKNPLIWLFAIQSLMVLASLEPTPLERPARF